MSEDRFDELVSLYLDREIGAEEVAELRVELKRSESRAREFQKRFKIHEAMRFALHGDGYGVDAKGQLVTADVVRRPFWILGSGLAAVVLVTFSVGAPALIRAFDRIDAGETDVSRIEIRDSIEKSDMRRLAVHRGNQDEPRSSSFVAEMRLMGLSPEVTEDKPLEVISTSEVEAPRKQASPAEVFANLESMSVMPKPQILSVEPAKREAYPQEQVWPNGFRSRLASFR